MVDGRTLRFQQQIQRFLADSRDYFELPGTALRQGQSGREALPERLRSTPSGSLLSF